MIPELAESYNQYLDVIRSLLACLPCKGDFAYGREWEPGNQGTREPETTLKAGPCCRD